MTNSRSKNSNIELKHFKKSLIALSVVTFMSAGAYAQSNENELKNDEDQTKTTEVGDEEVIEVRGMRSNISAALFLKRYSNTVVDSISAEDIGDFPDKSVAEALQRVPGITVERFGTRTDTAAFSVEPSGVLVRGLSHVRSEFNGRDSFSANSSRGLSWGDVSPELMGGIDVYKSQTAELIEGGIAGLINLRTRLPFDSSNDLKVFTVRSNYSELSSSATPELSGIYTTRFDIEGGELGFMANLAYSDIDATSQSIRLGRMIKYRGVYGDEPDDLHYIPSNFTTGDNLYTRQRLGTSLAAQWQDNDGKFLATLQYNRSQKKQDSEGKSISTGMGNPFFQQSLLLEATPGGNGSNAIVEPSAGTDPFVFDEQGFFQTGQMVQPLGWAGVPGDEHLFSVNSNGEPFHTACYDWAGCPGPYTKAVNLSTSASMSQSDSITEDFATNLKWNISEYVHANFDVQYVKATLESSSMNGTFTTFADVYADLTGELPRVVLNDPSNTNLVDNGDGIFGNPNSYYFGNIMDMREDSKGTEFAAKADFVFDVENEFVESVKVGARYAKRKQNVNNAGNWASIVNDWSATADFYNLDQPPTTGVYGDVPFDFKGIPQEVWVVEEWQSKYGFFGTGDGNDKFVMPNIASMKSWGDIMSTSATGIPSSQWSPICSGLQGRAEEVDGTCFRPAEMIDVSEETLAAYVQVNFGGSDFTLFGKQLSGNVGVRFVDTSVSSDGGELYPETNTSYLDMDMSTPENPVLRCEERTSQDPEADLTIPNTLGCYINLDDVRYANNASILGNAKADHQHVLPSFNLKMDISDNFLARIALSKAMSRPDIGSLRNYINITQTYPDLENPNDPGWEKDADGVVVRAHPIYTASASNPGLKPITANQVDLSFEYYSQSTSVSLALFHKTFDDYIQLGTYGRELTNNGVTKTVTVRGPVNGDGAKFSGLEVQGTFWFDFLPEPFNGLGLQANYTYIDNKGVENSGVNSASADGGINAGQAPDTLEVDTLEGLSKDAYNVVLMYNKDKFSARLAYNWRSEFLVTNSDCCIAYPVWQDDYGQLDASVNYTINDTYELSVSAQNLTDEQAVLTQQVFGSSDGGLRLPYATNQSDIRYTATLRVSF
jgi:iron complex outermembrane recepter protein